jgi:hypothetical protein
MNSKARTLQESIPVDHWNSGETSLFLTTAQVTRVILYSVFLWFVAAMFIQAMKGTAIFGGTNGILTFFFLIPVSWLSVLSIRWVGGLRKGQTISGVAVGLAAATFLDAVALTWTPWLYGGEPQHVLFGGASILWGVGLFLLIAYLLEVGDARRR